MAYASGRAVPPTANSDAPLPRVAARWSDPFAPLRIAARLVALVGLLAICVAAHYLAIAVTRRSLWPRRFLGAAARIIGADVVIAGTFAPAPLLLIANHLSWLDILVLAGATGTSFVAHDGLARQPFLHWLCRLNRTIFVARDDRGAIPQQTAAMRAALMRHDTLTLFPEGTTGDGVTLRRFRSSLLAAVVPVPPGLSVQPVLIDYGRAAPAIAWTDAEPGLANFLRLLARAGHLKVTLRAMPVLIAAYLTDRKTITAAAFRAVAGGSARP